MHGLYGVPQFPALKTILVLHRCSILCSRRLTKEHNGTTDILVSRLVHGEGGKMERKNYQRHWPAAVVKKSHRSYVCKICNNIKQHTEPSTAYHTLLVHAHGGAQVLGRKGRKWCHALRRCKGNRQARLTFSTDLPEHIKRVKDILRHTDFIHRRTMWEEQSQWLSLGVMEMWGWTSRLCCSQDAQHSSRRVTVHPFNVWTGAGLK